MHPNECRFVVEILKIRVRSEARARACPLGCGSAASSMRLPKFNSARRELRAKPRCNLLNEYFMETIFPWPRAPEYLVGNAGPLGGDRCWPGRDTSSCNFDRSALLVCLPSSLFDFTHCLIRGRRSPTSNHGAPEVVMIEYVTVVYRRVASVAPAYRPANS